MTAQILLAVALENTAPGMQMAGTFVDADGTATIELLERLDVGWKNITHGVLTTSLDMSQKFDDVVVTRMPAPTIEDRNKALSAAIGAVLFSASNFPERVQRYLPGQDMGPLRRKLTDAVTQVLTPSTPAADRATALAAEPEQV